ncbi:MAG: histone-like protein [Nanoarchaeota archaeon]
MKKEYFSVLALKRLFKSRSVKRVSKSAIIKVREIINKHVEIIADKALRNALYSGRTTILEEDIEPQQANF